MSRRSTSSCPAWTPSAAPLLYLLQLAWGALATGIAGVLLPISARGWRTEPKVRAWPTFWPLLLEVAVLVNWITESRGGP